MGMLRFGRSGQHCPSFRSGHWKDKVLGQWTGVFTAGRKDSFNQAEEGRGNCQRNVASVLVSRDAFTGVPVSSSLPGPSRLVRAPAYSGSLCKDSETEWP